MRTLLPEQLREGDVILSGMQPHGHRITVKEVKRVEWMGVHRIRVFGVSDKHVDYTLLLTPSVNVPVER